MADAPALSIILPTRNRARRLRDAIASVREQTWRDWELVVVDHASTDETPVVLDRAAAEDPRIVCLRLDEPSGPSTARNAALDVARGDFISFIDDDDRWFPRKAEVQLAALRERPDLGAVSCFWQFYDERTARGTTFRGPLSYSARALLWCNFPGGLMGMLRREAFTDTEIRFDESLTTCEDWDLWLRCLRERPMVTIPESLYRYTWHGPSQAMFTTARTVAGRATFVAKHRAAMSDLCRGFHEARIELSRAKGPGRARAYLRVLARLPARVRAVVARDTATAKLGWAIRDPGLAWRRLIRVAERG